MIEVMKNTNNIESINLNIFLEKTFNEFYDIVLYQTYPNDNLFPRHYMKKKLKYKKQKKIVNLKFDEINYYPEYPMNESDVIYNFKFNSSKIKECDDKFLKLQCKIRVLVDLHDDSDQDGFVRFSNQKHPMHNVKFKDFFYYRIKNVSSIQYFLNHNVLCSTTFYVEKPSKDLTFNKKIMFHFSMSLNNDFRVNLANILKSSSISINTEKLADYPNDLNNVFVEICAHGYGKACIRDVTSLSYGCLILLHESLKNVYILPNKLLIDNYECIYYNFKNVLSKLEYIQLNVEKCKEIAINGHKAFNMCYNYNKSSLYLENSLKNLVK